MPSLSRWPDTTVKKHTRKNLSEFVNDLRINYVCKLLAEDDQSSLRYQKSRQGKE